MPTKEALPAASSPLIHFKNDRRAELTHRRVLGRGWEYRGEIEDCHRGKFHTHVNPMETYVETTAVSAGEKQIVYRNCSADRPMEPPKSDQATR